MQTERSQEAEFFIPNKKQPTKKQCATISQNITVSKVPNNNFFTHAFHYLFYILCIFSLQPFINLTSYYDTTFHSVSPWLYCNYKLSSHIINTKCSRSAKLACL